MTTIDLNYQSDLISAGVFQGCRYNGFVFPPARHAVVEFVPEYSDDGRTVKYMRADLTIDFIVTEEILGEVGSITAPDRTPNVLNAAFVNLRRRLSKPGQRLMFKGQGIGDFDTQNGIFYDVNNGPKPQVVSWMPFGRTAAKVVWKCSTWFADCTDQKGRTGVAQFPYAMSWNVEENGCITRTITGSIEVPLSRDPNQNSNTANTTYPSSADKSREQVINFFPCPARFKRSSSWNLSSDRKKLSFSITDREIPSDNPYFEGIVNIDVRRSYSSSFKTGFIQWAGTVTGSVEVAPGYSKYRGWFAFASVFADIINRRVVQNALPISDKKDTAPTKPGDADKKRNSHAYITNIDIEEDIYGRTFNFRIGYILACSFEKLFQATGLFQPLSSISPSDASWNLWKMSMGKVQNSRGWLGTKEPGESGDRFIAADDIIVDLCSPTGYPIGDFVRDSNPSLERTAGRKKGDDVKNHRTTPLGADESYSVVEMTPTFTQKTGAVVSMPLEKSTPGQETIQREAPHKQIKEDNTITPDTSPNPPKPTISHVRPTRHYLTIEGKMVRIGYPPAVPNVKQVGNAKAYKIGTDIVTPTVLGVGFKPDTGQPATIYGVYYKKTYILEKRPNTARMVSDGHITLYQ